MASAAPVFAQMASSAETPHPAPKRTSVKALVESPGLTSIPSTYSYSTRPDESAASEPQDTIPVIDFSLLTSGNPDQRSKVVRDLDKACKEWGFFMLVNHGVPDSLMKAVLNGCSEFFDLPMEEKVKYAEKDVWKPIRFGTGIDVKVEKFFFWRDFLKVIVHPEFHFPTKPENFREVLRGYSKGVREVVMELLRGISEGLGFEECYLEKKLDFESGFQMFAANLYPPCPQPELAIGIPAHTDYGLLTLLIENEIGGLQIQHDGQWFNVNPLPNSILVNTGDHLEILTNGKYKSVMHRAVVNNKATRISIAMPHGPSLETVVSPLPELLERESCPAAYLPMKYRDFLDIQQNGKQAVEQLRLPKKA